MEMIFSRTTFTVKNMQFSSAFATFDRNSSIFQQLSDLIWIQVVPKYVEKIESSRSRSFRENRCLGLPESSTKYIFTDLPKEIFVRFMCKLLDIKQ